MKVVTWMPVKKTRLKRKYLTKKGMIIKRVREAKNGDIIVKWWGDFDTDGECSVGPDYQVIPFSPRTQATIKFKIQVEERKNGDRPTFVIPEKPKKKKFRLRIKRRK